MIHPPTVAPMIDVSVERTSTEMETHGEVLIPFVAIAHFVTQADDASSRELVVDYSFCDKDIDGRRYDDYAKYKLRTLPKVRTEGLHEYITDVSPHKVLLLDSTGTNKTRTNSLSKRKSENFMTIFSSQLGNWYVKSYKSVLYLVTTSIGYPTDVAIECLDELSETVRKVRRPEFLAQVRILRQEERLKRKEQAMATCCSILALKYGSLEQDSVAHTIVTQVDEEIRGPYSQRVIELMEQVDSLKENLHQNIDAQLDNIESAESLQAKAEECRELAKVFKKNAKKLRGTMWNHYHTPIAIGTAIVGGIGGFLIGGPAGAGILTSLGSVATAQAIEASAGAVICAGSYLGASAAAESCFWNQRFVPVLRLRKLRQS